MLKPPPFKRRRYAAGLGITLTAALVAACSPTSTGSAGSSSSGSPTKTLVVTVYGGDTEKFVREQVVPEFEKETGAHIELAVGQSKDWVTKMRVAGKDTPPYDVVIANKIQIAGLKDAGFFQKLPTNKVPNLADVPAELHDASDVGVQGLIQPLGLAYRTDLVKNPPKTWDDLWRPEYKGKLALYTPNNSAGIMFTMLLGNLYGSGSMDINTAFAKIKSLEPFKQSDFDMQTPLTRGEAEIVIVDSPAAMALKSKGAPVDFVVPKQGTFMFEQDINVASGTKVPDLALRYVNYMLSPGVQEKWANKFYVSPANRTAKIGKDAASKIPVTVADLSSIHIWTDKEFKWLESGARKQITDRWNREIGK